MEITQAMEKHIRKERVIQFGEGVFLRGFADVFFQILNDKGLFDGSVAVVKPRNSFSQAFENLKAQNGMYTHFERGLKEGKAVVNRVDVDVISRLINPYEEFESFISLAKNPEIKFIISNTTEAGIVYVKEEMKENSAAGSFPAKLTQLLYERYKLKLDGFYIVPCELTNNAGDELKKIVLMYADDWQLGEEFKKFVLEKNEFYNTLVDRIVTGAPKDEKVGLEYEDKAVNTSELYHLWVLGGSKKILEELPFDKAGLNVIVSDDIDMYHTRKVRILNGAHTSLVPFAMLQGFETVGECMKEEITRTHLENCMKEVISALDMDKKMLEKYKESVFERFENPYIKHYLKAIALNSVSKFRVRVLPSILDYYKKFERLPENLVRAFSYLIKLYKTDFSDDSKEVLTIMKNAQVKDILSDVNLWGEDLSFMLCDVEKYIK